VKEGYRFIWHQPFFRTMLVWSAISNLLVNACFVVVSLRLIRDHYAPAQIGLVSTFAGIGGILGALAAPYVIDRLRTGTLTVAVAWMCVLPLLPLVWWSTPAGACVSVFLILLLNPAGNAGIGAYRVAMTPDRLQGRVGSAMRFLATCTLPLSPVVGGALMTVLGGPAAIAAMGALTAVAALVVTLSRTVRTVPRPVVWQTALAAGKQPEAEPAEAATAVAAAR